MSKAIGMVEYKTVSAGITAADAMVKTSEVSIIEAQTVCPGKYIAIITGDLSAVKAAVDNAKEMHGLHLIDSFVLGNPHESMTRRLIEQLHEKGVTTLQQARRAIEELEKQPAAEGGKKQQSSYFMNYGQRKYSDEDLKSIGITLLEDEEDKK